MANDADQNYRSVSCHSRRSSMQSDVGPDIPREELDALLKRVDGAKPDIPDTLDLSQLEKFFRICAGALAEKRKEVSWSRATTFAANTGGRVSTRSLNETPKTSGKQKSENTRHEQAQRDRELVEKAYESNAQRLITDQSLEWAATETEWRPVLDTVEDVWQFHFPNCGHHGLAKAGTEHRLKCHPLCDPFIRRKAQEDIVLARLCLEHDPESIKDTSRFMPWLSLLGSKLEQLHTLSPKFSRTFADPSSGPEYSYPSGQLRNSNLTETKANGHMNVLVTILRYFYEGPFHYLAYHDEFRLKDLLDFCYLRDVLPRPAGLDDPILEENFRCLVHGLWCLNIIQTPRYQLTFTYPWNAAEQRLPIYGFYFLGLSPSSALMETLEGIERQLEEPQPVLPMATGENVRCRDLNIRALRKIGGLTITWSMCDRDHLFLDQENGILRLSFSSRALVPEFYKYMPLLGRNDLKHTWELLLGHRKHQYDFADLSSIALPPELKAFNQLYKPKFGWARLRKRDESKPISPPGDIYDIYDKYGSLPNLPRSVPYSYFGRYEERVRILRHYMDTRRPTGFVNLWHDRRDTLTYYTFWAVLIFGGFSVLLAALGLAVGIMQAYASFKALDQ